MSGLIGREEEQRVFGYVLNGTLPYRILAVSGLGGVGKSTLLEEFRSMCAAAGLPSGLINARSITDPNADHEYHPVVEVLGLLEQRLRDSGCRTGNLRKRFGRYRVIHREVTEKFSGKEQFVSAVLRAGVTTIRMGMGLGLGLAGELGSAILPIASDLDAAIPDDLPDQVARTISGYRKPTDRDLLRKPVEQLTDALLDDVNADLAGRDGRRFVLVFDEYELIPDTIDAWLRGLFGGLYRQLDRRVLLVIGGRLPLGQDWIARGQAHGPGEIKQLSLQVFTVGEAADYLQRHFGVTDQERAVRIADDLGEAGRLPLVMRLLEVDPQRLEVEAGEWEGFRIGALADELVKRLFDRGGTSPRQRDAALAISVARSFDLAVLEVVLDHCGIPDPKGHFRWLERQHFINRNAPAYTLYDLVREVFLTRLRNTDSRRLEGLHQRLLEYHQRRAAALGRRQSARKLEIEAAYHDLSCTTADPLTVALSRLLRSLPTAHHLTNEWSRTFQQVAEERGDLSGREKQALDRLARLLTASWILSNAAEPNGQREAFDPAMDVFFTSLYRIEPPSVSEADAELWLRYFESRDHMTTGNSGSVDHAKGELLDIWRRAKTIGRAGASKLLLFCVATDLGEACTRVGGIAEAVAWNHRALEAAREDGAPLRQALALYQLSTNLKRQGKYRLALANVEQAISLFEEHAPASSYHLGRFMLDKANTHTYLNEWSAAEQAFETSRDHLRDVSPQSFAELCHRLGWLKRVSGRLDEALHEHEQAIRSFEQIEAELFQRNAPETSVLPFLRGKALHSMGNVLSELGRHDEALRIYGEAIEIFQRYGNRRHEAITRKDRAWSRFERLGLVAAEEDLLKALSWLGDRYQQEDKFATHLAEGWVVLSRMRAIGGQLETARTARDRAHDVLSGAVDVDDPYLDAQVRLQRALLGVLGRDHLDVQAEVEDLLMGAEAYARAEDPPMWALLAHALLIRALHAYLANDASTARARLADARAHAQRWNRYLPRDIDELWKRLSALGTTGDTAG